MSGVYYAKPSQSYYQVGKELSLLYYEGHGTYQKVHVPAKGYAVVGDRLNRVVVRSDDLFSGIVDMHLPSEMNIATVIMPVAHDPIAFMKNSSTSPVILYSSEVLFPVRTESCLRSCLIIQTTALRISPLPTA